jgi:hypothetical protein
VTYKTWILIRSWIYRLDYKPDKLESFQTVSSTAPAVHLDQLLQQLLFSTGSSPGSASATAFV